MFNAGPGPQAFGGLCQTCRAGLVSNLGRGTRRRFGTQESSIASRITQQRYRRQVHSLGLLVAIGIGATFYDGSGKLGLRELHAETIPAPAEVIPEKPRRKLGPSKEYNRDSISSQHLQVKRSWENPGLYAWGSNAGRVAAPNSDELSIKSPRRIQYFDGVLLRDVKLDRNFGAAVTEKGDLLQWGTAYSPEIRAPTPTLTGKDLISITISRDRILALSSSGTVYSLPVAATEQISGPKPLESSWIPFWSTRSVISYRTIQPHLKFWGEKVSAISAGLDHLLLLTTSGRLFSAATSATEFPSKGQLGVPGLTWGHRPEGPYDRPHEINVPLRFPIIRIAAGDYHSLASDTNGNVLAFGDNSLGQLGLDYNVDTPVIDTPSLVPIQKLYSGTSQVPRVTDIAAGGLNSFFAVDATAVASQGHDPAISRGVGRIIADTWACGQGTYGGLGTGRWTHVQGTPTKIKALSGLSEWDEKAHRVIPIRLARLSVGSTHASATMNNVTHVGAHSGSSENDTNWGADVVWWGGNEYYQLGTGRRNNVALPVYIKPLDITADRDQGRREEHRFQITPLKKAKINGRSVNLEQRVECGRFVSAVYSGV